MALLTQPIRIIVRLVLVVAVTIAALGSATALAAPVDKASDRVAVHAFSHYVKVSLASLPASRRADQAFVHSISARCRDALARLNSLPASAGNPTATKKFVDAGWNQALGREVPGREPGGRPCGIQVR